MKERPILFSAPMVQAILAGTKTQTRRVVKPQPWAPRFKPDFCCDDEGIELFLIGIGINPIRCPYGNIGDQLWVREAWRWNDGTECGCSEFCHHGGAGYEYRATGAGDEETKWKPSIHMPRKASRIQLEITNIGVERLQKISEEDAIAEGMSQAVADAIFNVDELTTFAASFLLTPHSTNRILFESLWEKINGADSWAANPWVWVIEFKLIKP